MTADQWLRTILVFIVMASCYGWAVSMRIHWAAWAADPRARAVSAAILPILILNGVGIARSATQGLPITWVTWSFMASYLVLNAAMWVRLPRRS